MSSNSQLDSLLYDDLEKVDPLVADLVRLEEEQQTRKLILVASVSLAPRAALQALGSVFQNVCAEGYPSARMRQDSEERLRDIAWQLASYRRYADKRFYKGVEQVDLVESLAQRRCAELYAHHSIRPEHIYVNVQPLSGAVANLAVFQALMKPGDTLMGMDLYQGGHLTHGSSLNLSGQLYRTVSYTVDPHTERLDYAAIRNLARQHRPRLIVAGYTSYPWSPDWNAFREIADEVGAFLLADIAHTAGLVVAGVYPNPVGVAHVTTLTTNKTLCGPRGAVVMTTDEPLAQAIDRAIFPGEQSAPHANKFAAMAVAFHIAQSEAFRQLQRQIVVNAGALAGALEKRGLRLAYGGTDTHLLVVDLKSIKSKTSYPLLGEPAARILDLAGLVVNKNSLPGDSQTALATGIRLGTSWVTQRGLDEKDMDALADLISKILVNIRPFTFAGVAGLLPRGKIKLEVLDDVRDAVTRLVEKASTSKMERPDDSCHRAVFTENQTDVPVSLRIIGWRARQFIQQAVTANTACLAPGDSILAYLLDRRGRLVDQVVVAREKPAASGQDRYLITPTRGHITQVTCWLQGLSDGYILFDENDVLRKVEGPVVIERVVGDSSALPSTTHDQARSSVNVLQPGAEKDASHALDLYAAHPEAFDLTKPYFVGQSYLSHVTLAAQKAWQWNEPQALSRRTPLYEAHKALEAKMAPFAGWEMPIWYTSIIKEHQLVRGAAGLFDIIHMGVFQVKGPHATAFLDVIFSNYVAWLNDGQSCYGFLPGPDGGIIDDAIIYRCRANLYLMVVNAANEAKDWDWLSKVNERQVALDPARPWVQIEAPTVLQNLKHAASGDEQKCILALQGPASLPTLQALTGDRDTLSRIRRGHMIECELAGIPLWVARTGYTGEEWGYEIFVHPDHIARLWGTILEVGRPFGVGPAGLAARDSTRTEAGLPLWGRELAGPFNISPVEAGFPGYVKYHKPFFIGRDALLSQEPNHTRSVIRFRVDKKGVRRPRLGDPVLNQDRQIVGNVTSCTVGADSRLIGMALVEKRYNIPSTPLTLLPSSGDSHSEKLSEDRQTMQPVEITVLTRFPEPVSNGLRKGEQLR